MRIAHAVLVALAVTAAAAASPLVGSWVATTGQKLTVKADGTLTWNGEALRYQVQGNVLVYQGREGTGMAQFQVQGDQLVLAGQEIGMVQMRRAPAAPQASASAGSEGAAPAPTPAPAAGDAPAAPAPAQAAATAAPTHPNDFVAKPYGFRMTVASGWMGKPTEEALIFGHKTKPGMVLLTITDEEVSEADVKKVAKEGYSEPGFSVKPVTPGKYAQVPTGQGFGYYFRVTGKLEGKDIAGFSGVYLPPKGQAILVLAATTPEKVGELEGDARAMLSSVRLTEAVNPSVRKWDGELRGMKVEYMWSYYSSSPGGSYVGGSQNKLWHLCRDGTYWYKGRSNISVDGGGTSSGAWASGYSHKGASEWGRWEVVGDGPQGAAIVFRPVNSGGYRYPLHKKRKKGTSSFMQKHFGDMGVYAADYADCR